MDHLARQPDGSWNLRSWQGLQSVARVRCVNIDLPLGDLYAGVPDLAGGAG